MLWPELASQVIRMQTTETLPKPRQIIRPVDLLVFLLLGPLIDFSHLLFGQVVERRLLDDGRQRSRSLSESHTFNVPGCPRALGKLFIKSSPVYLLEISHFERCDGLCLCESNCTV